MVKAELSLHVNEDDILEITLDLLKREDWKEAEWELANSLQDALITMVKTMDELKVARLTKQEIIKEQK